MQEEYKIFGKPSVVVVGSLHMDLTVKVKSIPHIGETVLGKGFKTSPGGKGANQAIAASRIGCGVTMVGRVGADTFGEKLLENMRKNGVDINYVKKDGRASTGLALIVVDERGNNTIAVASGANMRCCRKDVDEAEKIIRSSDVLLTQLEIPLPVAGYAVKKASRAGVKTILNPAPAQELPKELLHDIYALTPNKREAELLSGVEIRDLQSGEKAAKKIFDMGVNNVALTLGEKGVIVLTQDGTVHVKGIRVSPVDTTGAGDTFCGALAVAISSGKKLVDAVAYANYAGALATTKMGAQEALPTKREIEKLARKRPAHIGKYRT